MTLTWAIHPSAEAMAAAVAQEAAAVARDAVAKRGHALIAVPGGVTPRRALEILRGLSVPWRSVTLVPTDERLVPAEDLRRNFRMLETLVGQSEATLIDLVPGSIDPCHAGNQADRLLQALPWPLDLAWLGMGGDGHTASLFVGPDFAASMEAKSPRRAIALTPAPLPPEAPVARVTLTGASLRDARRRIVTLTGQAKRDVLERAIQDGAVSDVPVGQLLANASGPTAIHWAP